MRVSEDFTAVFQVSPGMPGGKGVRLEVCRSGMK